MSTADERASVETIDMDGLLTPLLTDGDDPAFWCEVVKVLTTEIDARWPDAPGSLRRVTIAFHKQLHWLRPNQWQWTRGGGFAAPLGYGAHASEGAVGAVWLQRRRGGDAWQIESGAPRHQRRKGQYLLRVAVPGNTGRHVRAAIDTQWVPRTPWRARDGLRNRSAWYGWRRPVGGEWVRTAHWEQDMRR